MVRDIEIRTKLIDIQPQLGLRLRSPRPLLGLNPRSPSPSIRAAAPLTARTMSASIMTYFIYVCCGLGGNRSGSFRSIAAYRHTFSKKKTFFELREAQNEYSYYPNRFFLYLQTMSILFLYTTG